MKNIKSFIAKIMLSTLIVVGLVACEKDIFNQELYKKMFTLLSNDEQITNMVHNFGPEGSSRNISILRSGTLPLDEDVIIELEIDTDSLLDKYNEREHGIDLVNYAQKLDPSRYSIPNPTVVMKAKQVEQYSTIPIIIKMDGLSPDSTYFVPLRIKSVSGGYEINENKCHILYRPLMKNEYAERATDTKYTSKASKRNYKTIGIGRHEYLTDALPTPTGASKIMYPIGENVVRVTVAEHTSLGSTGTPSLNNINTWSMLITVGEDNKLSIAPYNTANLEIELVTDSMQRAEAAQFHKDFYSKLDAKFEWDYWLDKYLLDDYYYVNRDSTHLYQDKVYYDYGSANGVIVQGSRMNYYNNYYNNEFRMETGRKSFFLCYRYRQVGTTLWTRMQERLRID